MSRIRHQSCFQRACRSRLWYNGFVNLTRREHGGDVRKRIFGFNNKPFTNLTLDTTNHN